MPITPFGNSLGGSIPDPIGKPVFLYPVIKSIILAAISNTLTQRLWVDHSKGIL